MSDLIKFCLLGLGSAAVYALLASGVVVIYRGSGVVNFAHGGFYILGGYFAFSLSHSLGLPFVVAVLLAWHGGQVADLTAARCVERRLLQLHELARAVHLADGDDGRQHVGLRVADELALLEAGTGST